MTFTKEQLQQIIETDHVQCGEASSLARIALASLEAEPVAWLLSGGGAKNNVSFDSGNAYADPLREVTPLYTAHPAPVSVPAAMEMDDDFDSAFEHGKAVGWNAYRAAMLHGAELVKAANKLPDDFDFDRFNDVVWLEAVASNPHMHSPTTSTIAMVALELNRKLADGKSPVIPDGWVMVPVEPTAEMISSGITAHFERNQIQIHDSPAPGPMECAYVAMLAAAPQQEVK
ncbi:hypothetical protein UXP17_07400 [Enterobacter hormaechei]|nr:MAG TPA: hypothetical protein [Caudoviricetes sp.]